MIDAMAGHVYMEAGDLDRAIARFESALARYPNKMQLIYDYPEALLKAGRARDAAVFLERELARLSEQRAAAPDHRANVRGARQADAAIPASGRVLRMAGRL